MDNKGFTLVEVLIVIIILGVLASIGTPIYTGFVKDARAAEADAAIGAIISGEKVYRQKNNAYVDCTDTNDIYKKLNLDMTDVHYFTCSVEGSKATTFSAKCTVSSKGVEVGLPAGGQRVYSHDTKEWSWINWGT